MVCWHRNWGARIKYTKIPDELEIICKNDDGHEAVKMLMHTDTYEVGDNEYYLDDIADNLDRRHRINETDDESEEDESEEDESDYDMDSDSD